MRFARLAGVAVVIQIIALLATGAPVRAQDSDAQAHARRVLDEIVSGKFNAVEAEYDAAMKTALPAGKLLEFWAQLSGQVGAFKKVADTSAKSVPGYQVVTLVSEFQQATLDTVISITSDGHVGGIRFVPHRPKVEWRAPSYAKPNLFHERDVTITSGHWELPGTLTVPAGDGPFAIVVLVHGSGPHDDDETIGPNKTFKDLAWGLASNGVAVLRYTKRTAKYGINSGDDTNTFTVNDEVVNDVRAAVDIASRQPRIDPHRVYVLGHSWGGYLAPGIASGDAKIAGLVLLAASARPLEQVVVEQLQYFASLPGGSSDALQSKIAAAQEAERRIESPELKIGDTIDLLGSKVGASYFLDLRGYDPPAVAAKLAIPILVLQGARDYQVRDADFQAWKKALDGKSSVQFRQYSDLNHLFETGKGMATPEEYDNAGHVAEPVIADIVAWVGANSKSK